MYKRQAQGVIIVFGIFLFWDILFVRSGIGARIPLAALIAFFAGNISDIFNVGVGNLLTSGLVFGPIFYVMLFQSELAAAQAAMRSGARRQFPPRLRPRLVALPLGLFALTDREATLRVLGVWRVNQGKRARLLKSC